MIVVPYVPGMLNPLTRRWCFDGHHALISQLDVNDQSAYWWLLDWLWTRAPRGYWDPDLVIVEQDMLPAPGVVEDMLRCRRPWCTSPYPVTELGTIVSESLGCVKFAGRLRERHPDLMQRLGEVGGDGLPAKDWRRLDVRLAGLLRGLGYRAHTHRRSRHLHEYTP